MDRRERLPLPGRCGRAGRKIPYAPDAAKSERQPFRYLGRNLPLSAWREDGAGAQYLKGLSAVGYGEPSFAAFYPNCHSVFGFYDDGYADKAPDGVQYELIGWYSDSEQDYLNRFTAAVIADYRASGRAAPAVDDLKRELAARAGWGLEPGGEFPNQTLCYARLTFQSGATTAGGKPDGEERAVIIGDRLPRRGALSTVHLVSIEGRYKSDEFDYQGAADEDLIRLISLKSWRFACANEIHSFKGLLVNLNRTPSALRLPQSASQEAERRLAQGHAPLPHLMRQGEQTVSWYRGPLIPTENQFEPALPARAADELARYDTEVGLFDVSYAAAWELGRLLALQSKQFSVRLYHWKRANARCLKQDEQRLLHPHLPISESATEAEPLPDDLANWFHDLSLLQGVPFNYLVPDERMLPPESIRFFQLDPAWIDCLLDGAFSIGRVTSSDHAQDQAHEVSPASATHDHVSGFLLRSDVVSGWPGLLIDAYDSVTNGKKIDLLRMDRLSDNVLLCLFAGEAQVIEIRQRPEALHFGLDETTGAQPIYFKKLRDSQGVEGQLTVAAIPWRQAAKRAIDISSLAQAIEDNLDTQTRSKLQLPPMTSAQFALQMIEGVEKVVFQAGNWEQAKAAAIIGL